MTLARFNCGVCSRYNVVINSRRHELATFGAGFISCVAVLFSEFSVGNYAGPDVTLLETG